MSNFEGPEFYPCQQHPANDFENVSLGPEPAARPDPQLTVPSLKYAGSRPPSILSGTGKQERQGSASGPHPPLEHGNVDQESNTVGSSGREHHPVALGCSSVFHLGMGSTLGLVCLLKTSLGGKWWNR